MSALRDRYHHGDLPRALREAALAQLRAEGALGVSLRAATREVGVDPSAAYRHFRNKDALLQAVAWDGFDELARRMEVVIDETRPPLEAVRAIGAVYVRFALAEPEWFGLMFGPVGRAAKAERQVAPGAPRRGAHELLLATLEAWRQAEGLPWSADEAGIAAWAAVHGLAELLVDGVLPAEKTETALAAVLAVVVGGLRAGPISAPLTTERSTG